MKDNIKYNIHKADFEKRKGFEYHLEIKPTKNGLHIKNNIEDLKLARIHSYLDFFITDYYDPHILFGKFTVTEDMLKEKEFFIEMNINMERKSILYNHKYISVAVTK
jgi:hypothetical protein